MDSTGQPTNTYTDSARLTDPRPQAPWAIPLADEQQRFHLLAFDLDLTKGGANSVLEDAQRLTSWLSELDIEHTVAQSGPAGGRHIWLALTHPTDARTIARIADFARQLLPTLDFGLLKNPVTGCVRPPGAPHRAGGHSQILTAPPQPLRPAVTPAQIKDLTTLLASHITHQQPDTVKPNGPLPIDEEGQPYLPGPRRPLPPGSLQALNTKPEDGQADAALFAVLLGAARSHWHYRDLTPLLNEPGMEHIRTERVTAPEGQPTRPRRLRTQQEREARLTRQWDHAVTAVAATPTRNVNPDETFAARAEHIADTVERIQRRADAARGRWNTRTGPASRRVLDAVLLLALQALTLTVEADTRRLADITGLGRETVRTRLHSLAADGWFQLTQAAAGRRGHIWTLITPPQTPGQPGYSQLDLDTRSQGVPPPERPSPTLRPHLIRGLKTKLTDQAHDCFTPAGLGHAAGQLYNQIHTTNVTVTDLAETCGRAEYETAELTTALTALGIIVRHGDHYRRPTADRRDTAAIKLTTSGTLKTRRDKYAVERVLWGWWCDELDWMRLPRTDPAKRRRGRISTGQLAFADTRMYGRYPRRIGGRADFKRAATYLRESAA